MTRFFDSTFEGNSATGALGGSSVVNAPTVDGTSKMKDTYCVGFSLSTQYVRWDFTASGDVYVVFYLYLTTVANSIRTVYINNGCRLDIRSNRALRLQDQSGVQKGSDSAVLSLNTLYRVGLHWRKATIAGNDGQAEAYVTTAGSPDAAFGSPFASATDLSQSADLGRVDIGNTSGATANTFYIDNVSIDNASMPALYQPLVAPQIAATSVVYAPVKVSYRAKPPLLAATSQVFTPVKLANRQILTAPQRASSATIYAPVVKQRATAPLIAATSQAFAPRLVQRATAPLISSTSQVYAPAAKQVALPVRISAGSQVYAPVVANRQILVAPQIANGAHPIAPSIPQPLVAPRITNAAQLFTPSIHQRVIAPRIGSTSALYAPVTVPGLLTLPFPTLQAAWFVRSPVVMPGSVSLMPGRAGSGAQLYAPTVRTRTTLVAPLLASTSQAFAPHIPPILLAPRIASSAALFAPAVANRQILQAGIAGLGGKVLKPANVHQRIIAPRIVDAPQLFTPNAKQIGKAGRISSTAQTFAPAQLSQRLHAPRLEAGAAVRTPVVSAGQYRATAPRLNNAPQLFAPVVAAGQRRIQAPRITAVSAVLTPVALPQTVTLVFPLLSNPSALRSPLVKPGRRILTAPLLVALDQLFMPALVKGRPYKSGAASGAAPAGSVSGPASGGNVSGPAQSGIVGE